ncbi:Stp1/IreP family PP2C-type Ser/Thr phosphatase [Geomonas sp. RF6]|uniref:Stp1/IreP family PP2C-type Ser/Thr phosphatase n=1 Tax=Geomonas sp. RF6 TaxID=2897342 RepID=UPI001E5C468B|nr:Stp1/IreP family PP2C-type Ser/Thr phosphatase [Geomonas sp. RF6]UFS70699.1 Stp1/IreP family PP2C-type Ser/Thr phosphatase [Geomonas sp. RF6]
MKISATGKTDKGARRGNNEDAFIIMPGGKCAAVADGMGGAAAGEVASRIFVDAVREIFSPAYPKNREDVSALVREAFKTGNERILSSARQNPAYNSMGCTADLIAFGDDRYILGHVGDSRTYLFREGELRQLTKDHSLVQRQVEAGLITPRQARSHSMKNVILRALGIDLSLSLDIIRGPVLPADIFLLCSDGLSDMVEDQEISAILASSGTIEEKAALLVASALQAGGRDNITVVLCQSHSRGL